MYNHKKILDELLIAKNGIHVNSIHFVSDEIFEKNETEKLLSVGLDSYEPIYFSVEGSNYPEITGAQPFSKREGATICAKKDLKIDQVIFLKNHVQKELDVPIELQSDWRSMVQLIALAHEFGHVEDMQKSINFSLSETPTVKLVEAEAYAHTYALNYLNNLGASIARDTLSGSLYKLLNSECEFEKSFFQLISLSIGKDRLQKWATA
ncbi:MAG: hypothetical protein BWK74_03610 [Desulfobacteraceae bacterium A6]|nr:MAG: hypothetical protein BWK74_03610 [Desulfobacteraceae bacterium A6]